MFEVKYLLQSKGWHKHSQISLKTCKVYFPLRWQHIFIDYQILLTIDIYQTLFNPSKAEATSVQEQGCKDDWKTSKHPCHVVIHWKALAEYSQMSIHVPGFSHFSGFLHHLVLAKISPSSLRVNTGTIFTW